MKILVLASDKGNKFAPFIEEQIAALQALGVHILRYAVTGKGAVGYLKELPKLKQVIKTQKPDLIHAHFGLCGLLANLQHCVPVITTYHGCDINATKNRPLSRIAMRLSAWNVFVSNRQKLIAYGTEKKVQKFTNWSVIPCGIDTSIFNPAHVNDCWFDTNYHTRPYVLFAGRYEDMVKNANLAQRVIYIYNENNQDTPIEMIELCGYTRNEVVTLMSRCKALLLTSIREGSPQVIKEAMACGCPIVSVDVGDVAERVSGVDGCWVASSRDPKELAELLENALFFGRTKGREKLLNDGMDNIQIAQKLIGIYKKLTIK